MKISYIDGRRLIHALNAGGKALIEQRAYLDRINVFPVADSDTGQNLALTMQSVMTGSKISKSLNETLASVADAALTGAKGNSGIIFAQYLYGLKQEAKGMAKLDLKSFAELASAGVKHVYDSLMNPVEGTMLTVIREWAEYLKQNSHMDQDFHTVISKSLEKARQSLAETPSKLKILADAGVVDAGASGFVFFLEGIVRLIQKGSLRDTIHSIPELPIEQSFETHSEAPQKYRYCTEAILSGANCSINMIKGMIGGLGDSLILAGDKQKLHIHIHTNESDKVFECLESFGTLSGQKVDDMLRQYQISHEPRFEIGIITDSAGDLPLELLDEYQISVIPFGINFGMKQYLDRLSISSSSFYKRLRTDKVHPTSSQPSPTILKNYLDFSLAHYKQVIAIHLSDKLSGIYQGIHSITSGIPSDRLALINSRQLSVTEGLMILRVARAVEAGLSMQEIVEKADKWADNTVIYTDVNTLKYMVRGGRVKPLAGLLASILNIKPIVSLDIEGKAKILGKSFSRAGNLRKILRMIKREMKTKQIWDYAIVHAEAEDRARLYADKLTELTGKKPAYVMPLSAVVGVHNGIGTVGIGVSYEHI